MNKICKHTHLSGTIMKDAILKMNGGGIRTSFVISTCGNLIGSLSDGDIRRGLLKGLTISDSVDLFMNTEPISCELNHSEAFIQNKISEYNVLSMPILESGKVVRIVNLNETESIQEKENLVFIMAGGLGKRLKPLTDTCPKPMLMVGGMPMLYWTISRLKRNGFKNIVISTHYLPEVITDYFEDGKDFGVRISYVYEQEPLGTGGALSLLEKGSLTNPILVLNGDLLTNLNFSSLLQFHTENKFDVTMCLIPKTFEIDYGVAESEGNHVTGLVEKPAYEYQINSGLYVLNQEVVLSVPQNVRVDLPDIISQQIERQKLVGAFNFKGHWLDIGNKADFARAQLEFNIL
ncbi:nucleotidyltransferase family protein [Paracoccaceae bacterium]|nr:nucleotidyltransferase family protein [Paracoccaceae bacterium]